MERSGVYVMIVYYVYAVAQLTKAGHTVFKWVRTECSLFPV